MLANLWLYCVGVPRFCVCLIVVSGSYQQCHHTLFFALPTPWWAPVLDPTHLNTYLQYVFFFLSSPPSNHACGMRRIHSPTHGPTYSPTRSPIRTYLFFCPSWPRHHQHQYPECFGCDWTGLFQKGGKTWSEIRGFMYQKWPKNFLPFTKFDYPPRNRLSDLWRGVTLLFAFFTL